MKRIEELVELRGLDTQALEEKLASIEQELMNLKFRHASGQLEQTANLSVLRKKIARVSTLISEKKTAEAKA
jgi:large subunit ribosomal protein L29